jgi:hypothetical protein
MDACMRGGAWLWLGVVGLAAIGLGTWLVRGPIASPRPPQTDAPRPAGDPVVQTAATPRFRPGVLPERGPEPDSPGEEEFGEEMAPEYENQDMSRTWEIVDWDRVRAAMPDNLYWKLARPTTDPAVIEEREAERKRWNVEYGKVLSGTGTEEEVRAYYDLRAKLSTDYIEFTTHLLDHYREQLPERDIGLIELARRLHYARLEEIPRRIEEALARKREQDEARRAWLAGEAEFQGTPHP